MSSFTAISLHAAPRIECEEPKYDFGTVIGQEKITHDFIIWNRGDEPLEIVKIKNCCGVETKVEPMTIPPGSNAVCTSVFTTKNRYGTQNKQILLVTNDKKHLYYDLRMTGSLLKPVEFNPRFVRLGNLMPDSVISETITATNLLEKTVTLESVSTTVKGLDAEIGAVAGENADRISAPRRNWTIQLKSTGPLTVGQINGQVQLKFSSGTVDIPIVGEVKPIIQATPETIQLSSSSTKETNRLIMLRSGDERPFDVLSASVENAEGSVETKKLVTGKWQIKLAIQLDSIKPGADIVIKTSIDSQNTITIPLSKQ